MKERKMDNKKERERECVRKSGGNKAKRRKIV